MTKKKDALSVRETERSPEQQNEKLPRVPAAARYYEEEQSVTVQVELPGVLKEDIDLKVEGNILLLEAKSNPPSYEGYRVLDAAFFPCIYYRKFEFGKNIASEGISAELKDGILTVTLPKAEKTMRHIDVHTAA